MTIFIIIICVFALVIVGSQIQKRFRKKQIKTNRSIAEVLERNKRWEEEHVRQAKVAKLAKKQRRVKIAQHQQETEDAMQNLKSLITYDLTPRELAKRGLIR